MKNLVEKFYNYIPFNVGNDIKVDNIPWPFISDNIKNCNTVTELGCGTGWLSSRIKSNYPSTTVKGIDLSETAIAQAKSRNQDIEFIKDDITTYNSKSDMVISVGVLHHIPDYDIYDLMCKAINLSNKYTFIGLYHTQSRKAMFDFFNNYPEHKRKKLFKKMAPQIKNNEQRESWFRDQFEHPFETTTTLKVYNQVAKDTNTKLVYTNINTDETYNSTMEMLETFEFKSGFIYGGFVK